MAVLAVTASVVSGGCVKAATPTLSSPAHQGPPTPSASRSRSSPSPPAASTSPIVLVVMENHEYSSIVGSPSAPFINRTLIARGLLFSNYHAVSYPSLPNYLAMTSGGTDGKVGTDTVIAGELPADNLFHQLSEAGVGWGSFEETMPSPCYLSTSFSSSPNDYTLKHDPAMAYADVATTLLCRHVVPYRDLQASRLPAFSFVTPNECDDMHSCSVSSGDAWLRKHVPALLRLGATVIVTFDEGSTNIGEGGHVLTIEDGPGIVKSTNGIAYTHYNLLAGLEDHWHLSLLQHAKTATPLPV